MGIYMCSDICVCIYVCIYIYIYIYIYMPICVCSYICINMCVHVLNVKVHVLFNRVCGCFLSQFWLFNEIRIKRGIIVSERVDTKDLIEIRGLKYVFVLSMLVSCWNVEEG
jgi:hypothetical protein